MIKSTLGQVRSGGNHVPLFTVIYTGPPDILQDVNQVPLFTVVNTGPPDIWQDGNHVPLFTVVYTGPLDIRQDGNHVPLFTVVYTGPPAIRQDGNHVPLFTVARSGQRECPPYCSFWPLLASWKSLPTVHMGQVWMSATWCMVVSQYTTPSCCYLQCGWWWKASLPSF